MPRQLSRMLAMLVAAPLVLVTLSCARPIAPDPVDREIENLRAFAKLYGYVRWFHPSPEAVATDWNAFAVDGVAAVRDARDSEDLHARLTALFEPVSDGVELFTAPPPQHEPSPRCDDEFAWQHLGFGGANVYRSVVARRDGALIDITSNPAAQLHRQLPVDELRARTLRIRTSGMTNAPGSAYIIVSYTLANVSQPVHRHIGLRRMTMNHQLLVDMPENVADATVTLMVRGATDAWFGALDVASWSGDDWHPLTMQNLDFAGGDYGWHFEGGGEHGLDFEEVAGATHARLWSRYEVGMRAFDIFPEPGEEYVAQVSPGLWASIPLTTCMPPASVDVDKLYQGGVFSSEISVAAVIVAWNALQHFYPYFDTVEVDWDGVLTDALRGTLRAATVDDADRAVLKLVAAAGDGHGNYIRPGMAEKRAPPIIADLVGGDIVVTMSRTDAVQVGDRVLSVDGRSALSHFEDKMRIVSGSPQWKRYVAGSRWFAVGGADTSVRLQLERDRHVFDVDVPRDVGVWRGRAPSRSPMEELERGIWYVDLGRMHPSEFRARAGELRLATGVVLDMRGYPVDGRGSILAHFADRPLYSQRFYVPNTIRPDRQGNGMQFAQWDVELQEPRIQARVAMLIGGAAISAAETVASLAAFHDLAEMVGSPTAGANGNVVEIQVPGGGLVVFTGLRVQNQDSTDLHLRGIQPTVPVEPTIEGIRAGRDEVLEKAVEILRQ